MLFLVHADAGINGSSERIVAVLVRSDTAVALNVTVGSVQVLAVQQIGTRQLLINVSATVPMPAEQEAVAAVRDLSAGELSLQHMCRSGVYGEGTDQCWWAWAACAGIAIHLWLLLMDLLQLPERHLLLCATAGCNS